MAFVPFLFGAAGGAAASGVGASLATALTVGAGLMAGVGGLQQAQYQAAIARNNAEIERNNAKRAADATQLEYARSDAQYGQLKGQQEAAYAASGLDTSSGTPATVTRNTDRIRQMAGKDIYQQGAANIANFQGKASSYDATAAAYQQKGLMDLAGGLVQAATPFATSGWKQPKSLVGSSKSAGKIWFPNNPQWNN